MFSSFLIPLLICSIIFSLFCLWRHTWLKSRPPPASGITPESAWNNFGGAWDQTSAKQVH